MTFLMVMAACITFRDPSAIALRGKKAREIMGETGFCDRKTDLI
jgi:hypothetical protein